MNINAVIAIAFALVTVACSSTSNLKDQQKQYIESDNQTLFITSKNEVIPLDALGESDNQDTQKITLKEINYNRNSMGLLTVSTTLRNNSEAAIQIDAKTQFQHASPSSHDDSSTWKRIYVPAQQEVTYKESSLYDAATSFTLLIRESAL